MNFEVTCAGQEFSDGKRIVKPHAYLKLTDMPDEYKDRIGGCNKWLKCQLNIMIGIMYTIGFNNYRGASGILKTIDDMVHSIFKPYGFFIYMKGEKK